MTASARLLHARIVVTSGASVRRSCRSGSGTVEGKVLEVMRRTSEGDWVYIIDNPYGV